MKNIIFFITTCLFLFFNVESGYSQSCNCLPGWQFMSVINVTNSNSSAYTDFEVCDTINTLALISAGKMKADGGDIRFTDALCYPLNYYVESGINTNATIIWINVNSLPANSTKTIYMFYGNPAAITQSNPIKTFSFYEGFDNNTLGRFLDGCGTGPSSVTFADGVATFSWDINHIWYSDMAFPLTDVFTADAKVTSVVPLSRNPGLYWAKDINKSLRMSLSMFDKVTVGRSSELSSDTVYCRGGSFHIGPEYYAHFPAGIWSFTWVATGSQVAGFPANEGYVTWSTTDSFIVKNEPLRLLLGVPGGGTGYPTSRYSIDWVRVRKYAPVFPFAAMGSEISAPKSPGNSLVSTVLGSTSIRINWADSSDNESLFMIDRSLDGGSTWAFRDSVPANTIEYTDLGLTPNTEYCYRVYATNCMSSSAYSNVTCATTTMTGINLSGLEIPKDFGLYQNYPNPFNPVTNIKFDIPKSSFVKITIFDVTGRKVTDLVNRELQPGAYTADWNASSYASGIYFYRIEAGEYVNEMKMVLLK